MPYPLVSVVIATLGDSALVMNALDSLKRQTFKNFDVIIVNQGPSLMKKMIKEYSDLTLQYHEIDTACVSFSRNYAASVAAGFWLAYMDDDAQYSPEFLASAVQTLNKYALDGLTGVVVDAQKQPIARSLSGKKTQMIHVDSFNLWMCSASIVSKEMAIKIGGYDSEFGPGKRWGCGEEADFLLRLIDQKAKVYFDSNLYVYHPSETEKLNTLDLKKIWRRGFSYGAGRGALIRKHSSRMPVWGCVQLTKMLLAACLGVIQSILMIRLRYGVRDIASLCGRFYGFFLYK
ncbi:hypothetical protein CL648_02255 [bacterium]|jgi:glycosyltransferase involved in cell wall biosynthesis|nr:hypothetical protein [bacterium]|tara:strand:- start:10398 stop:11264 length:867 start_codon:yes stop_codon:yes gene_type:complete